MGDPINPATMARTMTAEVLDMWPLLTKADLNERGSGFVPPSA
jgi:hypothetical protein